MVNIGKLLKSIIIKANLHGKLFGRKPNCEQRHNGLAKNLWNVVLKEIGLNLGVMEYGWKMDDFIEKSKPTKPRVCSKLVLKGPIYMNRLTASRHLEKLISGIL